MSQERVELVRRGLEAWNRGDIDGVLEMLHPQIEWVSEVARRAEGADRIYRGKAEMRSFCEEWFAVWKMTIEVSEFRDSGDTMVGLGQFRAHGEGSGIALDSPVGYVFEFEDNLVRKMRSYLDPQQALEAVGLSE